MKLTTLTSGFAALVFLMAPGATADVVNASPNGFELRLEQTSKRAAKDQFERIFRISEWWGDEHTYSGDASNLRINTLAAGGQWKEVWGAPGANSGGDVEHGRVIAGSRIGDVYMVRFDAALGPLQEMGVRAVLTIEVEEGESMGSQVRFKYYVTGADFQALDEIAPVVDGVLAEQIESLVAEAAPELPVAPDLPDPDAPIKLGD